MNAGILTTMMPQLLEVAPDAVYVIVTNPCDVLTVLAQEQTGLPPERIFASGTVLDTSRLRWKLGAARRGLDLERARLHRRRARRHRVPAVVEGDDRHRADPRLGDARPPAHERGRARRRSPSTCATPPTRSSRARARPTTRSDSRAPASSRRSCGDEHAVMPVSTVLHDFHGLDGVALSVPSIVSASGARPIRETSFSAERARASPPLGRRPARGGRLAALISRHRR